MNSWADQVDAQDKPAPTQNKPASASNPRPQQRKQRNRAPRQKPTETRVYTLVPSCDHKHVYLYDGERRVSSTVLRQFPDYRRNPNGDVLAPDVRAADFDGAHAIVTGNPAAYVYNGTPIPGGVPITPAAVRILAQHGCDFTTHLSSWHSVRISRADLVKLRPGCTMPAVDPDGVLADIICIGDMYFGGTVTPAEDK